MPRSLHLHSHLHGHLHSTFHGYTGLTLMELIIVAALIGTLSAIAFPSILRYRDTLAVSGAITDAAALLHHARQFAIAQRARATILIDTATGTLIQTVESPLGTTDSIAQRPIGALHNVALSASRLRVTYLPSGAALGGSNLTLIASRATVADTLTISRLGRVKH